MWKKEKDDIIFIINLFCESILEGFLWGFRVYESVCLKYLVLPLAILKLKYSWTVKVATKTVKCSKKTLKFKFSDYNCSRAHTSPPFGGSISKVKAKAISFNVNRHTQYTLHTAHAGRKWMKENNVDSSEHVSDLALYKIS